MTKRDVVTRWKEHLKTYGNPNTRMYNFKIYQAMREIGIDKFSYEIIEECDNSMLEERERYWIEYHDSSYNGYNTALGGAGKPLITDYQIRAMKILYENGWMLEEIERTLNVNKSDIGEILRNKYGIDTLSNSIKHFGKHIYGVKNDNSIEFLSISEAARYLINAGIPNTDKVQTVISKINNALNLTNKTAYGYKWTS